MVKEDFLDLHDDISLLACLLDRVTVLHEDIEDRFIRPINNADEAHDLQRMLVCAGAGSYRAKIKAELISDILAEARTMANSLVRQTLRAREEHDKTEAATDTQEGANPSKGA